MSIVSPGEVCATLRGATFCFTKKFDPALTLRMLVEHKVTFLPTFPIVLEQVGRLPEFEAADLSSLEVAWVGGARIPPETLDVWRRKGVLVKSTYGMTEVGGSSLRIWARISAWLEPECTRRPVNSSKRIAPSA